MRAGRPGAAIKRLLHDREGVAAIEFAILAPLLMTLLMGTVATFGLFRAAQVVEKATFTVGDVLSRQSTLNAAFLQATFNTLTALVPGDASQVSMRVTSLTRTNGRYAVAWSKVLGKPVPAMTTPTIPSGTVPDIADGDSILITDTYVPYRSAFSIVGFGPITFSNSSVYRPRFTGSIAYVN